MDILSGSWPGEIYWFRGKGNGTYAASQTIIGPYRTNLNVGRASAVAVADWDGDSDLDLVIGNITGEVWLVKNSGSKTKFVSAKDEKLKGGGSYIKVAGGDAGPCIADWDGDSILDLILGAGDGSVIWCRNTGNGRLESSVTLVPAPSREKLKASFDNPKGPATRTKVCVADWNGDGRQDLLVGDFSSGGTRKYHGWVWVFLRSTAPTAASAK